MGMQSLKELYKIGRGPSSSHTMGPERACKAFLAQNPEADSFKVVLYGSLSLTGKGHGTDRVIVETFGDVPCEVEFCNDFSIELPHPNTMDLFAYKDGKEINKLRAISVGGGRVQYEGSDLKDAPEIYKEKSFTEIKEYCEKKGIRLWQYAEEVEGPELHEYMLEVWKTMKETIERGLADEGILPGGLEVVKRAKKLISIVDNYESPEVRSNRLICAYAFATAEQNADAQKMVTAPTCGACGVVPAVMYYRQKKRHYSDDIIVQALESAGVVGNVIKMNGSISGAECGCQAEIGSACAMAAAGLAELFDLDLRKIEYAAEVAIEHHLGLTCDPVCGLVQIPCIERNAVAAMRAFNAVSISTFLSDSGKMTLDNAIKVMKETGKDLSAKYRETSEGGLATISFHGE